MKRLGLVFMALVFVFSVASCSCLQKKEEPQQVVAPAKVDTPVKQVITPPPLKKDRN